MALKLSPLITIAQWAEFNETDPPPGDSSLPVNNVTLADARAYAAFGNNRLPTIADLDRSYDSRLTFDEWPLPALRAERGVELRGLLYTWTEEGFAWGGSWDVGARHARSAVRFWYPPGYRLINLGFRIVLNE